ncbi:hypothetical protein O181_026357 [Austropuccinia psidii MF-1]|uniref:Uncharacterized protein n=1 Tax=Austropuccinia psidii MF-1 TaxID=1389203 RepID=A0A9Q3H0Q2_9BASI|nr:hypothetical protein [Austropuccinia psidii MF-1]
MDWYGSNYISFIPKRPRTRQLSSSTNQISLSARLMIFTKRFHQLKFAHLLLTQSTIPHNEHILSNSLTKILASISWIRS